jgi:conjugal transfer pilus assembly protein TraV
MRSSSSRGVAPAFALCASFLAGCASLSGLDGGSSYACKAPEGVTCDSVSGTYHNALQNNLPSQRRPAPSGKTDPPSAPGAEPGLAPTAAPATPASRGAPAIVATTARTSPPGEAAYLAAPLRAAPRILRLWIKPWEDADRDLNGESLVYVQVDNGRWLVDHVQRQVREAYAPVRPGKLPTAASKPGTTDAAKAASVPNASPGVGTSITQQLRALQNRSGAPGEN